MRTNPIKSKVNIEGYVIQVIKLIKPLRKKIKKQFDLTIVKMLKPVILIVKSMYSHKK
jgi:hypothetical protein